jgi:hypothetical protein
LAFDLRHDRRQIFMAQSGSGEMFGCRHVVIRAATGDKLVQRFGERVR